MEGIEKPDEWAPLDGIGMLGLPIDAVVTADVASDDMDSWLGCRRWVPAPSFCASRSLLQS